MKRHDGRRPFKRFDRADATATQTLDAVYRHIFQWLKHATLDPDPDMPAELRGRLADNWRPLISLSDACSPAWGTLARDAALIFARASNDEDQGVILLYHLRAIFDAYNSNRLASELLIKALIEHDELWSAWRGPRGDYRPRKLTQGSLAELLRPFDIKPRKFWVSRAPPKSARGYLRADLEAAWCAYCADAGTPEHPSARKYLRSVPLEQG